MSEDTNKIPPENDQIEYKSSWKDKPCFQTLCAFSNTKGGSLYIGITNDRKLVGISSSELKKLHKNLPGQIRNNFGFTAEVYLPYPKENILCIKVLPVNFGVKYNGIHYIRSGEHDCPVTAKEFEDFLKRKPNIWDEHLLENIRISDLDKDSKKRFLKLIKPKKSLPTKFDSLLEKLDLKKDNKLKKAGLLLFHPNPSQHLFIKFSIEIEYPEKKGGKKLKSEECITEGGLLKQMSETIKFLSEQLSILSSENSLNYKKLNDKEKTIQSITESERKSLWQAMYVAVILKDYSMIMPIQIEISKNKVCFKTPSLTFKNNRSQDSKPIDFISNKIRSEKNQNIFIKKIKKSAFSSINYNLSRVFKKIGFDIEEWINTSCNPAIAELKFGAGDSMFQINFERNKPNKNFEDRMKPIGTILKHPAVSGMMPVVIFLFFLSFPGFIGKRFDKVDVSIRDLSGSVSKNRTQIKKHTKNLGARISQSADNITVQITDQITDQINKLFPAKSPEFPESLDFKSEEGSFDESEQSSLPESEEEEYTPDPGTVKILNTVREN